MELLYLSGDYYTFPEGISDLKGFVTFAGAHYHQFAKMTKYTPELCVSPFFIAEEAKAVYVNIADIHSLAEIEATILPREEYDTRLNQVVQSKCIHCKYCKDASDEDDLKPNRSFINLNGECWRYEKAEA